MCNLPIQNSEEPFFSCLKRFWKSYKLNEKMIREGYAEVMYIPPSEFDSREWGVCIYLSKSCKIFI